MNFHASRPTTAEDFLRWNETRDEKNEFVRGRVVSLPRGGTQAHSRLITRLVLQLANQLEEDVYDVGNSLFAILTRDGVRFPDVFVDRVTEETSGKDMAARVPVFLAEVLSPESMARDFGEKKDDYLSIPSLVHYLILSQDEPCAWLWSRGNDGEWAGPEITTDTSTPLVLSALGVTLDLGALYRGMVTDKT